jgi:hypothetical protein
MLGIPLDEDLREKGFCRGEAVDRGLWTRRIEDGNADRI